MAKMSLLGVGDVGPRTSLLLLLFLLASYSLCYARGLILVPTWFLYSKRDLRFGFIAHNPSICNDPDRY